ncbi:concanavalin A-like lectin/glucanase, partial [Aureobasidium melanogenum]
MIQSFGLSIILAFLASSPTATGTNNSDLLEERATARKSCMTTLPGVGRFNQYVEFDSAKWSSFPLGLSISNYGITADPDDDEHSFDQYYEPNNVILKRGRPLQLRVSGGQTKSPIQGAEFTTAYDDILYASVRTVAKVSSVPGTCHGFFFYHSDTQETDIEIRTSYPDQKSSRTAAASTFETEPPYYMTAGFHEHRFDWLKGVTKFYIDGEYVGALKKNVPTVPDSMVWNNWANGGSWSGGPPQRDNILEIQSIEMYYNRTSHRPPFSSSPPHTTITTITTITITNMSSNENWADGHIDWVASHEIWEESVAEEEAIAPKGEKKAKKAEKRAMSAESGAGEPVKKKQWKEEEKKVEKKNALELMEFRYSSFRMNGTGIFC